jgi:hypothetical protein
MMASMQLCSRICLASLRVVTLALLLVTAFLDKTLDFMENPLFNALPGNTAEATVAAQRPNGTLSDAGTAVPLLAADHSTTGDTGVVAAATGFASEFSAALPTSSPPLGLNDCTEVHMIILGLPCPPFFT